MDSGTLTLALVSYLAILFLLSWWVTKQSASWMQAENARYGHALMAMIVAAAVGSFPAFFLRDNQLLVLLAVVVVTVGVYAKILGASFMRGFGIVAISSVLIPPIGLSMALLYAFALGFPMFDLVEMYSKDSDVAFVRQKADDVCRCGTDEICLEKRMLVLSAVMSKAQASANDADEERLLQGASERAFRCVVDPPIIRQARASEEPAPPVVIDMTPYPPREKKEFRYRDIDVAELSNYVKNRIRIETTRDTVREGYLSRVQGARMTIGEDQSARGLAYEIPISEIRRAQVYEEIQLASESGQFAAPFPKR